MSLRIFVTGGTGFLGRELLASLLEDPRVERVYALNRREIPSTHAKLVWIRGDLRGLESCPSECFEVDYVYHLGANARFTGGEDYAADNTEPVRKLIERLRASTRLRNLIFVSSVGAFDREAGDRCDRPLGATHRPAPRSEYGESKLAAENLLRTSGLPVTIVRPTWIYGRGMRSDSHLRALASMTRAGGLATKIPWPGAVGVVHVKDLTRQLVALIGNAGVIGQSYFVASENVAFTQIFAAFGARPRQAWRFPARFAARFHAKLPPPLAMLLLPYLCVDPEPWIQATGVRPQIHFLEGAADVIADLRGGVCVITGAASGIGLALARRWRERDLVLIDLRADELQAEFPTARCVRADLSEAGGRRTVVAGLAEQAIAVFVNNAGVGSKGATDDLTAEQFRRMLEVNFAAPVELTQGLARNFRHHGTTIVNVTSSVAFRPLAGMSLYAATKAALQSWSEALAEEWRGICPVITFAPTGTRTAFQQTAGVKSGESQNLRTPEDVAAHIDALVARGRSAAPWPSGAWRFLIWGSALLPRLWRARLFGELFRRAR